MLVKYDEEDIVSIYIWHRIGYLEFIGLTNFFLNDEIKRVGGYMDVEKRYRGVKDPIEYDRHVLMLDPEYIRSGGPAGVHTKMLGWEMEYVRRSK